MKLNSRELATVLSALRHFNQDWAGDEHFDEIEPLTQAEIDALCERLNCGEDDK